MLLHITLSRKCQALAFLPGQEVLLSEGSACLSVPM